MKRIFAAILGRLRRWLRRRRLRRICNAMGIIPYPWQAEFAIAENPGQLPDMGRQTGKTTAVILRALVQPPPINKSAPSFIALDPDAGISLAVQHCIYDDYRSAHVICVKARAIPNRPPLPLRTIPRRLPWRLPESIARSVDIGKNVADGLAAGIAEAEQRVRCPGICFSLDGLDAFMYAVQKMAQEMARLVSQAGEALCDIARALPHDSLMIAQYATRKEAHYIAHARKARTRKKYRNRVLRRARRIQKKGEKHEQTTPCT